MSLWFVLGIQELSLTLRKYFSHIIFKLNSAIQGYKVYITLYKNPNDFLSLKPQWDKQ